MWTISVEFQFYAAFVGLWLLYAALPERHRKIGFALFCIGLVLALWRAGYPGGKIAITHYGQFFLVGVLAAIILWHAPATAEMGGRQVSRCPSCLHSTCWPPSWLRQRTIVTGHSHC